MFSSHVEEIKTTPVNGHSLRGERRCVAIRIHTLKQVRCVNPATILPPPERFLLAHDLSENR
jgi:hypothetical protein